MWQDVRTHVPVLLEPAMELLAIRTDGIYVDATFGAGGHSKAILARLGSGRLIALDADPSAALRAQTIADTRLTFVHANFRTLALELDRLGIAAIDGVLFDLGVSSMQFDDAGRGFSVGKTAPLDMRMNPHAGRSAYDVLATASEGELADIFFHYGEERSARRIAHAIVERRTAGALPTTTTEFASLVSGIVHRPGRRERIHPATRVFQALRVAVNDELDALREVERRDRPPARSRTRGGDQFSFARGSYRETHVSRRPAPRDSYEETARPQRA